MDRSHPFFLHDAQIYGTVTPDFEESSVRSSIVEPILRRERHMVFGSAYPDLASIAMRLTDDMFHRLQNRKIGRGLIAAAEWRDVTLEAPLQLQSERRRDDHVAGRLVFARVEVTGVKINGKENRMRKRGTERLDDEKSVIGISAQYPDGSRPLPFIMNACD